MTRVLLYSPANLNVMDGSSIWVQSVAETFAVGRDIHVVLPLKAPERRALVSGALRAIEHVEVLAPERFRSGVPPSGLDVEEVLDWVERLDRELQFDIFVLRSFEMCDAAARRPAFVGRLWSTYILEPERDVESAAYLNSMGLIADASEYVVCQSEEMRALLEHLVPAARGRTILLPPAIPPAVPRADAGGPARRLIYTGKFHPFYAVPELIDVFVQLRIRYPTLEFHAVGDKIWRTPDDHAYADAMTARLGTTDGLAWHGAISRAAVAALLADGGVALSVWDHRHGSRWNDLVVSTKLLDYCAAGLPVVLNRTIAQEAILGSDYPLFVDDIGEIPAVLNALLSDNSLYRQAAERCWDATRRFTYDAVFGRLAPYLERPKDPARIARALADREKLPGASLTIGLRLARDPVPNDRPNDQDVRASLNSALRLLQAVRARDTRFRLSVLADTTLGSSDLCRAALAGDRDLERATTIETELDPAAWAMTVGWFIRFADVPATRVLDDPAEAGPGSGGSIPVVVPAATEASASPASVDDAAAAIVAIVNEDGWRARSDRLRGEAVAGEAWRRTPTVSQGAPR